MLPAISYSNEMASKQLGKRITGRQDNPISDFQEMQEFLIHNTGVVSALDMIVPHLMGDSRTFLLPPAINTDLLKSFYKHVMNQLFKVDVTETHPHSDWQYVLQSYFLL